MQQCGCTAGAVLACLGLCKCSCMSVDKQQLCFGKDALDALDNFDVNGTLPTELGLIVQLGR